MYGRANYGQFGQGSQKPMPSAYQQQLQAPPPPPPLHFQQGHTTPLPPVTQQALVARPPQISQLGPRLYHHGRPTQNTYQIPSGVPPEILCPTQPYAALPPPPPPPPSQGKTAYRDTVPPPPPPPHTGGVQGLRHIPPPPPPPPSTSGFFVPTAFGSSIPSMMRDPQGSSMAPPPPPIQPSPPLSSSLANPGAASLSVHSDFCSSSKKHSTLELGVLDHVEIDVDSTDARDNAQMHDGFQNLDARSACEIGPLAGDGSSFDGSISLNLPPPPPKPTEEKTVQKIEALCQDIAKHGPKVEVATIQNESRNPEFGFLFGGEPESEATIAHEYFQWLKKRCILAYKMHGDKRESALRSLTNDSSSQPNYLIASAGCTSPSDSDMEMEG